MRSSEPTSYRRALPLLLGLIVLALASPGGAAAADLDVTITAGPPSTTPDTQASFSWSIGGRANRIRCKLDAGYYTTCASPKRYFNLAPGAHTFRVVVSKGNTAATAVWSWTVTAPPTDTTPDPIDILPPIIDPTAPATGPLYWGGRIVEGDEQAPWQMSAATTFESHAGKGVSIINWSSPWARSDGSPYRFQTAQYQAVRDHGAIPFMSWANSPGTGSFTNAAVAAGSQDAYLREWASAAKAWGHPFFLRFAWEMNGAWFPWGVGNNGTTAADFVAMWRHVHDVFESVGATNATWVWCPNIDPYDKLADLQSLYPGTEYVDWTCLDGYNSGSPGGSFEALFKPTYDLITTEIAPDKPMLIGEVASTEVNVSKADWISDMFQALPTKFPGIRALLWFNNTVPGPGGRTDWPIESSASAQAAFASGIASPLFADNVFGSISTSPIPPID